MIILLSFLILLIGYIAFTVIYNFILVGAYFFIRGKDSIHDIPQNKFCILIPAYNEELLLGRLLDSLHCIDYPRELYKLYVVADNCDDQTANIARTKEVTCLVRTNLDLRGKGYALSWALEQLSLDSFDAILIIDADNYVDSQILKELDNSFKQGACVIQCHNTLANPESSWFTRILYVVRVIDNTLVHYAKQKLGLSSFLMGNGMCISVCVLKRYPWGAFTLSEDFEYYTRLILNGIHIDFNYFAKVYHQESISLGQAYSQRSRWAAGKFYLMRRYAWPLLMHGVRQRRIKDIEASFIILLPHTSLLFNLSLLIFVVSWLIRRSYIILITSTILLLQIFYLIIGLFVAKASTKTIVSLLYAPIYLVWKGGVDLICLLGLSNKEWKRTSRSK
jgi:cellulose synthase/poly-beta-1,6-N-acetylglucosamine synthase-like glycosyltransferase